MLIIAIIGLKYLLSHPYLHRWRPTWTQPFVIEETGPAEFPPRWPISKAIFLFVIALVVFGTGLARLVTSPLFFGFIALTVAWVSFVSF